MRALVLDDSKTTRMILRRMFTNIGFAVSEAEDGAQGLKSIQEAGKPDFVTVDWDMPVMDGLAFVRAVRAEYPGETLPIIMIAVANDRDHVSTALKAGVNEYLMKPFTEEMVREKLELCGILQD
jgi:two-component system, chemotaxis family, chemotaxis protein CheY